MKKGFLDFQIFAVVLIFAMFIFLLLDDIDDIRKPKGGIVDLPMIAEPAEIEEFRKRYYVLELEHGWLIRYRRKISSPITFVPKPRKVCVEPQPFEAKAKQDIISGGPDDPPQSFTPQ